MDLCNAIKIAFTLSFINQPYDVVRGWCKQYCDEHWRDENLNWNVSSVDDLFNMLENSSYYNPINPGLLKFLANKLGIVYLINSVKNYEAKFSCKNIEDIDFICETTVIGNNISRKESTLIVNALLENKVTIGKLWNICTPRCTPGPGTSLTRILTLDASKPLLEFYYSVKVCICC